MNKEKYEATRQVVVKTKDGAVWSAFMELKGMLNISRFARVYFNRSQSWFSQKLHGCTVCNIQQSFSADEYSKLAQSFRELARQLNQYADEIDKAEM